jgi:TP53 regulating kinase-like protein
MDNIATNSLLSKGAEASLYLMEWQGFDVVIKKRIPKTYRPPELDKLIRIYRTIHEPQLMHEAKAAGVPTPLIYMVNVAQSSITMQYIQGEQIKRSLNEASEERRNELCEIVGKLIGKLHSHGLIHGDLTTSNMILSPNGRIYFVDFGLSEKSSETEAQGVDLHLLKRALQSTHYPYWEECFKWVLSGYTCVVGVQKAEKVYQKICEIERRGRYVEERKNK